MVPALGAIVDGGGSLLVAAGDVDGAAGTGLSARGDGFGATFCFFLAVSGSADGEREAVGVSSAFLFLVVFSGAFFTELTGRLAVGVLALRLKDASADKGEANKVRNFEPISPRRLAANSASCAASAACDNTGSGCFFSFFSLFFGALGLGAGVATGAAGATGASGTTGTTGTTGAAGSGFSRLSGGRVGTCTSSALFTTSGVSDFSMLSIWSGFSAFSLVSALGNTFSTLSRSINLAPVFSASAFAR
jgi:hypothetical protein